MHKTFAPFYFSGCVQLSTAIWLWFNLIEEDNYFVCNNTFLLEMTKKNPKIVETHWFFHCKNKNYTQKLRIESIPLTENLRAKKKLNSKPKVQQQK